MKKNNSQFRYWFGFSRRERSSSFILLIIIVLIIVARYLVPETNMAIEDVLIRFPDQDSIAVLENEKESLTISPFPFDPNTVSFDSLIMLGLDAKEANTLINYRNKGGRFRQAADINKIYGLEEAKARKLIPFVELFNNKTEQTIVSSIQHQRSPLDLNSCDSAKLILLPGIGPVLSVRIIKFRQLLGGFTCIEQLKEVYGLSEETFELIKSSLVVDTMLVQKIKINFAGYGEFSGHPYFDRYEVSSILKYRELKGIIKSLDDLINENLISETKANKIGPYLSFEY